ncbi:MAG: efflux RND transporter permease subunit [Gammaproteobacteria bacterium]|nr:efflux RND transporter permease subunit [Gammaproteobacteria bacterium]
MAIRGTMGLIGLAINDSIVVLSALNNDTAAKLGDPDAIVQVVLKGSRLILSTTLTTVGGFLPLILFGDRFWRPLATAASGGVAGVTLLVLVQVPALFLLITRNKVKPADETAALVAHS